VSAIAKILKEMKDSPKGKAKPYQVRQVLLAIEKIEVRHGS